MMHDFLSFLIALGFIALLFAPGIRRASHNRAIERSLARVGSEAISILRRKGL